MSATVSAVPLDMARVFTNVRLQLQAEPQRYRLFGLFWWWIKPRLAERFDRVELPILGDYTDPEQAALVAERYAGAPPEVIATAALEEYGFNARFPRPEGRVEWGSELYRLHAPDVDG